MLMVPGRVCTSSPELGVPTSFADISEFKMICEMSEKRAGYVPELSYGSHIFQDLVEADILYAAVFDNEKTLKCDIEKVIRLKNHLAEYYPEGDGLKDIIGVYYVGDRDCYVYHDMKEEHLLCIMSNF